MDPSNVGFASGAEVEYFSQSRKRWVLARVITCRSDGLYDLDCRAGVSETSIRAVQQRPSAPHTPPAADIAAAGTPPDARKVQNGQLFPKPTFSVGEDVEYLSESQKRWVAAKVVRQCGDGYYDLDRKVGVLETNIRAVPRMPPSAQGPLIGGAVAAEVPPDARASGNEDLLANGIFSVGDDVEYFSESQKKWVAAKVIRQSSDGFYDLDRRAGVPETSLRVLPNTRLAAQAPTVGQAVAADMSHDGRVDGHENVSLNGPFSIGAEVEYLSESQKKWVTAKVIRQRDDGLYDLDRRAGVPEANIRALPQISPVAETAPAGDTAAERTADAGLVGEADLCTNAAFPVGAEVEYRSASKNMWVAAKVIRHRRDGLYDLDCSKGVSETTIRAPPKISPWRAPGAMAAAEQASPVDEQPQKDAVYLNPASLLALDSAICVGSADDIGPRPTMEDAFVFRKSFGGVAGSSFLAIYDGHGGRECVDIVARELHKHLLREMEARPHNIAQALCRAFAITDKSVYGQGVVVPGCTACCCVLRKEGSANVLHTGHVGDSRAVLCRDGNAIRLTAMSDHKPTDPDELMRVHMNGGVVFDGRVNGQLAMARALGDHHLKAPCLPRDLVSNVPNVTSIPLEAKDEFIIMACDGLWDVMEDQAAVDLVLDTIDGDEKMGSDAADVLARVLVDEALARGTTDNVTCVVVFPRGLPASISTKTLADDSPKTGFWSQFGSILGAFHMGA